MRLFRKKFGRRKVAFVFVSDDMEWGIKKLKPANKEVSHNANKGGCNEDPLFCPILYVHMYLPT